MSGIDAPRGADAAYMREALARAGVAEHVMASDTIANAYGNACSRAGQDDRIVAFGSFYTVAAVLAAKSAS